MKRASSIIAAAACAVIIQFLPTTHATAAEIKVLCADALRDVMAILVPRFEQSAGDKILIDYATINRALERIGNGEAADLVILTLAAMDELERQGKVIAKSRVDLARSRIGLAVRAGAPKPDIATPEAFAQAMLAANAVAVSSEGSGIHFLRTLNRLGIGGEMKSRIKFVDANARTADLVASGETDMAVQLISELLPVRGIEIVGPFPPELDHSVVLSAALLAGVAKPQAAQAFAKFLSQPENAAVFKAKGMEAVSP